VEIAGQVKPPKGAAGKARTVILVAENDCLAPDARIIGRALALPKNGKFSMEVFSKWGADLTVCAAVEDKPGKPITVYGKSAKVIHAEQAGEIVVSDVVIPLERKPAAPLNMPPVTAAESSAEDRGNRIR
jgi:hypothetical protein